MKSIRDLGYLIESLKPLKLPRCEPGNLPDPGSHTDCLIIINDPSDGPRARLALSNGASWDLLARTHELVPAQQHVDVVPMVRQAVRDTLPTLLQQQQIPALIPAPLPAPVRNLAPVSDDLVSRLESDQRDMAAAMLEMVQTINDLQHRVHYLENNALDVRSELTTKERAA